MTDDSEQRSRQGNVRRVTSRDRKRRIEARDLSYPPDELPSETLTVDETPANESEGTALDETQTIDPPARAPARGAQRNARPRQSTPAPRRKVRFGWRDLVAAVFLLATCGAATYFVHIWNNPYSPLNPLSPPLLPVMIVSETPLPTATATATTTPTARPSATFTPLPAEMISPNAPVETTPGTPDLTLTLLAGTPSATPPPPPFALLRTGVVYTTSAEGCSYSGIAGSVVDFDGQPLNGYIVWITGEDIDSKLTTGSDNTYGAGGFVLQVDTTPDARPYAAQVLAQDGETPLSDPFTFLTRDVCEYNVALVRFVQVEDFGS